jgi:hypothetical protein
MASLFRRCLLDPVLHGLANLFVGGELQVQNGVEGYAYRGKIETLEFVSAGPGTGASLRATLEWMVKADGERLGAGYAPTNGWDEVTRLDYTCNTDLPSPEIGTPNIPNVMFNMDPEGSVQLIIHNPYTGDLTVLFPRGGSQLEHSRVRWLPDGPKAKADAARVNNAGDNTPS